MKVFMLKDVEKVGMAGTIVNVSDGFASNFLFPRKLALEVTAGNEKKFVVKVLKKEAQTQAVSSKIGMLAERLKDMVLTVKEKTHDDGKLYGSVGAEEVVALLKEKDISVDRKQIEFAKSIKSVGEHKVTVKLSSKLKPQFTLKVVALASK
ncbi:MAG: 50S ribosomal protein L9 [candidate division TM6 bacterium GW2011_GWF2_37_49]|nr:MAG: 50S ribosomal protein L9 [candidate division TM6 bacterium GW2011_GWF2_37_49]